MRNFKLLLPLLLIAPLFAFGAKKPRRTNKRKPLPECLALLNRSDEPLIADYIDRADRFPLEEESRRAGDWSAGFGAATTTGQTMDMVYRNNFENRIYAWMTDRPAWKVWQPGDVEKELKELGEFPMIAGVVSVARDNPPEQVQTAMGIQIRGGPAVVTRTYIGVIDHFDEQEMRIYIRELLGPYAGRILSIDVSAPDFLAHVRPAPAKTS